MAEELAEQVDAGLSKAQVRTLLGVGRNGVTLPPRVVGALANVIIDLLEPTEWSEAEAMTKEELLDLLRRGMGYTELNDMPLVYANKVLRWFGLEVAGAPKEAMAGAGAGPAPSDVGGAPAGRNAAGGGGAAGATPTDDVTAPPELAAAPVRLERPADAFGCFAAEIQQTSAGMTPTEVARMKKEVAAMELSPASIIQLLFSLECGALITSADCVNMGYGQDPRTAAIVRQRNKACIQSLSGVLSLKDAAVFTTHLTKVATDCHEAGLMRQANLIQMFVINVNDIQNMKLRWEYLAGYFGLHRGHGLPVSLDHDLLLKLSVRQRESDVPSASRSNVHAEKQDAKLKTMAAQLESMRLAMSRATKGDEERESRPPRVPRAPRAPRDAETPFVPQQRTCYKCGKQGHLARHCTEPPAAGEEREVEEH